MRSKVFFHLVLVTVLTSDTSTQGGVSSAQKGSGDEDRQQLKVFRKKAIETLQSLNESLFQTKERQNQYRRVMKKIAEMQERTEKNLDRMATALEELVKIRRLKKSKDDVESKPMKKSGEKKRSKTKGKKSGEKERSKTKKTSRGKKRSKKMDKKLIFKAMIKKIAGVQNQTPERINQILTTTAQISTLLETLAVVSCQPPWTLVNGSRCILITRDVTNRSEAEEACWSVGGKIFAFEDEDDVKAVKTVSHRYNVTFWVGHELMDGQWKSTDGPSAYNPPESLYHVRDMRNESTPCTYVKRPGDLRTTQCDAMKRTLCRRDHSMPKPTIFPWQDRPDFLLS